MITLRKFFNWCKKQLAHITIYFKKPSIQITAVNLSGDGSFIDIRYYLTRPDKLSGQEPIFLLAETTGISYKLMRITKFGTVKTRHSPYNGHGILLFRNTNNSLQPSAKVTLFFGKLKVNHLEIK